MASTNQTTHYELSQYSANDKPTYLVDYNGDMSKIDTGIYNAQSKASVNENNIGDLTNLTTTAKNNLVSAINELDTDVGNNTTAISNLNTSVGANTGNIGTIANLETTDKSNLVNAINEVEGNVEKFNLTHFDAYSPDDFTLNNINAFYSNLTVATNDDGSIFKVYGQLVITKNSGDATFSVQTRIRPTSNLSISCGGVKFYEYSNMNYQRAISFSIDTNGVLSATFSSYGSPSDETQRWLFMPCLYFAKDFGDTPINN